MSQMEGTTMDINMLPEDCISAILSFTSPADAFRSSMASSTFRSAADSDLVWEKFLPSDYNHILSASVDLPLTFSSRKEVFRCLSRSILIDGGTKSLKLEKCSGKVSYTLSARELCVTWSHDPVYWTWKSCSHSRFKEVVELRMTSWLEIKGKMRTKMLSPNTMYGAYLIMNISERAYGLDLVPSETSIEVGDRLISNAKVFICTSNAEDYKKKQQMECLFYGNRMEVTGKSKTGVFEGGAKQVLRKREDGWMEIELGEFFVGDEDDDEEVKMSLMEVKGFQLKAGLIVQSIEVRPQHS